MPNPSRTLGTESGCRRGAARPADPAEPRDDALVVIRILEGDIQYALFVVVDHFEIPDVALFLEDLGDLHFQLRGGMATSLFRMRAAFRILVSRSAIGSVDSSFGPFALHHEALMTPGISPLRASSRRQSRHMSNFR